MPTPHPRNRWNQWDEGAYWLNVHDRKRWMTAGGATSLSYDGESWNFTLNENNKYVEHKRRRCFLQEHCEALNWSAHARKAPLEYEWDLKKKKVGKKQRNKKKQTRARFPIFGLMIKERWQHGKRLQRSVFKKIISKKIITLTQKKITLTITHLFLYTVKYIQYNKYK